MQNNFQIGDVNAMDVNILLKIGGVGILVAVINQVLSKAGRDDQTMYVSLAGVIIVLLMLIGEIDKLFSTVRSVFGF